ncbi:MAG: hypothetical protein AMXMBFR8_20130 [Nevskiales bacterium]
MTQVLQRLLGGGGGFHPQAVCGQDITEHLSGRPAVIDDQGTLERHIAGESRSKAAAR